MLCQESKIVRNCFENVLLQCQRTSCISQLRVASVGIGGIICCFLVESGFNRCILMNSDSLLCSLFWFFHKFLQSCDNDFNRAHLNRQKRASSREQEIRCKGGRRTDGLVRRHRMSTTALNCERLLTAVVSLEASHHRPSPAHTPGPHRRSLSHQRQHCQWIIVQSHGFMVQAY